MKGHIIIPEFYRTRFTDDWRHLLAMVAKEFRFKVEYNDNPRVAQDTEVVILFAVPHHMRPTVLANMATIPRPIKVIGYMKDIQHYDKPEVEAAYKRMFDRYDVILSSADEAMRRFYPEYMEKSIYFPDFFGPHERYADLPYNEKPLMRCLVSGSVTKEVYPLRAHILDKGSDEYLDYLPGPLVGHDIVGDKYAGLLNRYFCVACCSGIFHNTVAKYFEIPAAGALLIANRINDLYLLGFEPWKHYVPIVKETAIPTIKDALANPDKYEPIRKAGREFVLANHSIRNRFEQIKKAINGVLDNRP